MRSPQDMIYYFSAKYFPAHRKQAALREIYNFVQIEEESLPQAWGRLLQLLNALPDHPLKKNEILDIFYNGLPMLPEITWIVVLVVFSGKELLMKTITAAMIPLPVALRRHRERGGEVQPMLPEITRIVVLVPFSGKEYRMKLKFY